MFTCHHEFGTGTAHDDSKTGRQHVSCIHDHSDFLLLETVSNLYFKINLFKFS